MFLLMIVSMAKDQVIEKVCDIFLWLFLCLLYRRDFGSDSSCLEDDFSTTGKI